MTQFDDLRILTQITQTHYQQAQQALQTIIIEENVLRAEIAGLDQKLRQSHADAPLQHPMRAIGAEVIWQGWVGRAKQALNMKLARLLAVKEHHLAQVRRAYGKLLVTEQLLEKAQNETRLKQAKVEQQRAMDLALFGDSISRS